MEKEKLKGIPIIKLEVRDFNHCRNMHAVDDKGFKGCKYT